MKQSFTTNIIFLVLINLLVKPFYVLIIDVEVQNTVGTQQYGVYFAIFNFCYLFQIIADLGIQNYNSQYISKNRNESQRILSHILGVKLVLALAFILIAGVVFRLIGFDYPYRLFGLIAINQVLVSFVLYIRSNLAALGYFALNSVLSVLDKLILTSLLVYWLWFSKDLFSIYDFIFAQTISLFVTLFVALIVHSMKQQLSWPKFDLGFGKELITKSLPYALVILLMTAFSRMDGVMLERLLNDDGYEAGVYAAAYRLLDAANMIAFLFAALLLPMFAHILDNKKELHALCSVALRMILCGAIPLTVYIMFFGEDVTLYLYDHATKSFAITLQILFPTLLAISIGYIYGTMLTAAEQIQKLNLFFVFGIFLNFILNLYLIPQYQSEGAAIATIITQFFVTLMQIYVAYKTFDLKIRIKFLITSICYALLSVIVFYFLSVELNFGFIISLIIGMILLLIVAIPLKILNIQDFLKMSKL